LTCVGGNLAFGAATGNFEGFAYHRALDEGQ